jgi:alkanesulfonate monooxygenase SsuD/methylene tetrahydromethanopterin reductase-like flavin-dependent oxidoreductase (luciferase family)
MREDPGPEQHIVSFAVEGRFLNQPSVDALRAAAEQARADGVAIVFVSDGPLGDAITLAAALGAWSTDGLIGVRVDLEGEAHRHPTLLAREVTTLDHICGGRAVLVFRGPFTEATAEAVTLCRQMFLGEVAASEGPYYPVAGAINRPGPVREGGPPIGLDLSETHPAPAALLALVDLVLLPAGTAAPAGLPSGVQVCQIQGA